MDIPARFFQDTQVSGTKRQIVMGRAASVGSAFGFIRAEGRP